LAWQLKKDLLLSSLKKMQVSIISLFVFQIRKHVLDIDFLESFRRRYEGPLTEVLLKIKWMIGKLIQDNVVVLRTIRLPRDNIVHPRDEVDWCASAGSACEEIVKFLVEKWYSSTVMVDE
jgi:hypothetical protein